jgi:ribosome-associated translation inhibitor RaiA
MNIPLQITFRGMERSSAVTRCVRARVEKLAGHFEHILACEVVIEEPHRHHARGRVFQIRIDLALPGAEIVVRHEPATHAVPAEDGAPPVEPTNSDSAAHHQDAYVAIHDAFDIATRRLEERERRQRKKSRHQAPPWREAKVAG